MKSDYSDNEEPGRGGFIPLRPGSIIFGPSVKLERVFYRFEILVERFAYSRFGI